VVSKLTSRIGAIAVLLLGFLTAATAQDATRVVHGTVSDSNGAVIRGAKIVVVPTAVVVLSNENGEFSVAVVPGTELKIQVAGFAERSERVSATANEMTIVMEPEGSAASVTVTDSVGDGGGAISSATKTLMSLRDIPQSINVIRNEELRERSLDSVASTVAYIPGVTSHQGENNRDQIIVRGNSSSADFFVDGVRDDVQYYRDFYNVERLEALKGPNAMIFGRGAGGGVINRVTKEANLNSAGEVLLQLGSFGSKRASADLNRKINDRFAMRLSSMFESSGSFRDGVHLRRYGINPTAMFILSNTTALRFSYEHFNDRRTADRGIPSFAGLPVDVPRSTFFGNADNSKVRAGVNLLGFNVDHSRGRLSIRNHTLFGVYDKFYQNYVPGAVTADKQKATLTAYSNASHRRNVFNQTDFTYSFNFGKAKHNVLAGTEVGQQETDNLRNTGFFNNSATSVLVPLANPSSPAPVVFRQSATDANNHLRVQLAAGYIQDQVNLSRYVELIGGVRFDYFELRYHNNRNGDDLTRIDHLVSPRLGVVIKPFTPVSIYGSYSVSSLPSSGDQFSSLTVITQQVKPERFTNYEVGTKVDLGRNMSLTAALYRLDRTNTRATDPNDPTRILQTGSQRTNGFETGIDGSVSRFWRVAGGYSYQDAFISSATVAAPAGAKVAQVPHHTLSLWNHFQINQRLAAAAGVITRSNMFAAIDNKVTLPGYTRIDVAAYYRLSDKWRLQMNVENLFDLHYFINADNNNNISPGRPRSAKFALQARF